MGRIPGVARSIWAGYARVVPETLIAEDAIATRVAELAAEIGFALQDLKTGGGSDGNFTAALGVPTLDGLGVDGQGAHSAHEQMYYSSLEPRASLMIRLFETLE